MNSYISLKNISVEGFNPNRKRSLKKKVLDRLSGRGSFVGQHPEVCKILTGINFEAKSGDRIGILGPNGCGKTSLLRAICGTYPSKIGTVEVVGSVTSMLGFGAEFEPSLDAVDNIKISMIYSNRYHEYSEELCQKILEFAELEDQKNVPLYQYSAGMSVRLAFAVNIFKKSNILITDEIFATGDARFVHKSRHKMLEMWDSVDIAITVSHNMDDIRELCKDCYVMQKGQIVYFGKTEDAIKYFDDIYTNNPLAHR